MEDLLKDARVAHSGQEKSPPSHLTAVITKDVHGKKHRRPIEATTNDTVNSLSARDPPRRETSRPVSTPEEALHLLRSQPDADVLIDTVTRLGSLFPFGNDFDLSAPGPLQAKIITALINSIIPDFWSTLDTKDQGSLVLCLSNVTGLNGIVAKMRQLATASQIKSSEAIIDLLQVLERVLKGDDVAAQLWTNLTNAVTNKVRHELAWKETLALLGSGRVVATVAQALDSLRKAEEGVQTVSSWLSQGSAYAEWLGRNIGRMSMAVRENALNPSGQLLGKALNLGYPGSLVKGLLGVLVPYDVTAHLEAPTIPGLVSALSMSTKRQLLEHILRWLSEILPSSDDFDGAKSEAEDNHVSAVAAILSHTFQNDEASKRHLIAFLADPALSSGLSMPIRRACLALLSAIISDELQSLMEKTSTTFGEQLFITHAPLLQQQSLAQTLLLTAGYLHRLTPMAVLMMARSSTHMQSVGNRLDSSNHAARKLGMIVATALSELVDKDDMKMRFGTDEMESEDAIWYLQLTKIDDKIGELKDFLRLLKTESRIVRPGRKRVRAPHMPLLDGKPLFGPPRPPQPVQTEVIGEKVIELLDEASDGDGDLKPYAKPDSDPEDSDEDATLVNRNKPRPPVYIRSLMAMLRDDKEPNRFQMGIRHAVALIRRKQNFGSEVKDHSEELMRMFCNLGDPFDTEDFEELRLQAMIAVLLSDVPTLAPWLSRQAFAGEYSIAQRCVMLTVLGLGGRELAGFKLEDEAFNPATKGAEFPSKRLPARLHAIYSPLASSPNKRLEAASRSLEHELIQPMALRAADHSTAHLNAVKVRTFSSRLSASHRTERKLTPNQLAKVFGVALFFPLVGRYQQDLSAYGSGSLWASTPVLLVTLLKTLSLLLHASGPATAGLSELTVEFWELLLSLRVRATGDISVLQAVLFAFLTLLEVNGDKKRLADECARQVMETQQWVEVVFERFGGGEMAVDEQGREEETKVRTLAAGVLVKCRDVAEAYQKRLFGQVLE